MSSETIAQKITEEEPLLLCRLCESHVTKEFTLEVLSKYRVGYYYCQNCQSLQTSTPFWLEETYSGKLPNLDEGAARRALRTSAIVMLVAKGLRVGTSGRLLDFGGGDGLTCRLLRDVGFDAYCYDKFMYNFYSDGYSGEPSDSYDIIIAVELFEHLSEPKKEIGVMFSQRPRLVIVATEFYDRQGPEWPYIGNEHGGHVFFYSEHALAMIAEKFGYEVVAAHGTAVFSRERLARWQRLFIKYIMRPEFILIGKIWMQVMKPSRRTSHKG